MPGIGSRVRHIRVYGALAAAFAITIAACGPGAPTAAPLGTPAISISTTAPTAASVATAVASSPPSTPAPALKLLWEGAGPDLPKGAHPATYSPAIDPLTGDIWVALSFNGLFWIFSSDGQYKDSFGEPGNGPGQFDMARPCPNCSAGAIAFAPDGTFYVADVGNNRIQRFDPAHAFVREWGTFGAGDGQLADANQIATDGKTVYVHDDARLDVQAFDTKGTLLRKLAGECWIAVSANGHLFRSCPNGIFEHDATGAQIAAYEVPALGGDHIGLAVDSSGRLYFNIQNGQTGVALALVRYDPASDTYERWLTAGETLAVDPSGTAIYMANYVSDGWSKPVLRKYELP